MKPEITNGMPSVRDDSCPAGRKIAAPLRFLTGLTGDGGFDALLSELSTGFANVSGSQIESALLRLSACLDLNASPAGKSSAQGRDAMLILFWHLLSGALARKKAEEKLAESEARLKRAEEQLRDRLSEIEHLKKGLEENNYHQTEFKQQGDNVEIIGQSPSMKRILLQAEQVAPTESTVLILGETGTGKELLARAVHNMSTRRDRPLVTVNCAALPPTLIESELFGREKGAYTGALTRMAGRFEVADGSSIFLDEIGELPLELQAKLLRVIEEGMFERLGSTKSIHVNVRIIAATNRDITRQVQEGTFRKDLFYRLNVFPLVIPPLRERSEDIPLMVWSLVREFQEKMGRRIDNIPKKSMDALQAYPWPGNGRELRNVIESSMIVSKDRTLEVILPEIEPVESMGEPSLREVERRHILSVLARTGWRVTGRGGAAEVLGLKGTTLQSKMKKLGIRRPTI